eukprot:4491334-Lingulodinium_polyedra.AAC.1
MANHTRGPTPLPIDVRAGSEAYVESQKELAEARADFNNLANENLRSSAIALPTCSHPWPPR